MKTTDELRHEELTQRVEDYRNAYQDRDLERMLAMFADDAVMFWARGTFQGKAAIRKVLEQDVRECSSAVVRDTGLGILVAGRSVVWERQVSLTVQGVPVREDAVTVLEFDDAGLIRQFRSYYDKLGMMNQIASGFRASTAGSPGKSSAPSSLRPIRASTRLRPDHHYRRGASAGSMVERQGMQVGDEQHGASDGLLGHDRPDRADVVCPGAGHRMG